MYYDFPLANKNNSKIQRPMRLLNNNGCPAINSERKKHRLDAHIAQKRALWACSRHPKICWTKLSEKPESFTKKKSRLVLILFIAVILLAFNQPHYRLSAVSEYYEP